MSQDAARNAAQPEKLRTEATDARVKCSLQSVLPAARRLPFLSNRQGINRFTAVSAISPKAETTGKSKKKKEYRQTAYQAESDALFFFYGQSFLLKGWIKPPDKMFA